MEYFVLAIFLGISLLLLWFLISSEKGPKEPAKGLWAAFGFGLLSLVTGPTLDYILFGSGEGLEGAPLIIILISSLGTGFLEETFKFGPLALYIYKKNYFTEHSDGIIYFAIVGLTFGFFENLLYTIGYGAEVGLERLLVVPIFHGASTAIIGYFLAKQKVNGGKVGMTLTALIVVAIIHGMYNFGMMASSDYFFVLSLMLTLLLVVGLFIFYGDAKEKDLLHGLSVKGPNEYCKFCGTKNIKRSIFCEYCGKKL